MAEQEYRNCRHVVYKLHAHLTFDTKYRKKVKTDRVTAEPRSAFKEVCGRHDVTLDTFHDTDHAHLLVSYPSKSRGPHRSRP